MPTKKTPAKDAQALAASASRLAERLAAAEAGDDAHLYTKADVDRLIAKRLVREQRKVRELQEQLAISEAENAELHEANTALRSELLAHS